MKIKAFLLGLTLLLTSCMGTAAESNTEDPYGLALHLGEQHYFVPYGDWEVLNLELENTPLLLSYCTVCQVGIVYDPIVNGEVLAFEKADYLHNDNLVLIDDKTDSHWSQVLGEAISGELTGTTLEMLPAQMMQQSRWEEFYTEGIVVEK